MTDAATPPAIGINVAGGAIPPIFLAASRPLPCCLQREYFKPKGSPVPLACRQILSLIALLPGSLPVGDGQPT